MVTIEELTLYICGAMLAICLIARLLSSSRINDRTKRYIQPPRGEK